MLNYQRVAAPHLSQAPLRQAPRQRGVVAPRSAENAACAVDGAELPKGLV
jgi:hypothetical protein